MKLMRDWCPAFPETCAFTVQPDRRDMCPFIVEKIYTCTLDRICQPRPVVNGIVLDTPRLQANTRMLIVRRSGTVVQAERWAIPGGGIHSGETLDQSVIREVYEETGHHVRLIAKSCQQYTDRVWLIQDAAIPFQVVQAEAADDPYNFVGFYIYCYWDGKLEPDDVQDIYTSQIAWFCRDEIQQLIVDKQITPLDTVLLERYVLPQWDA